MQSNKAALERVLADFQISGRVVEIHEGPAVTQFEVEVKAGTRVSRITSIHKVLSMRMEAINELIHTDLPEPVEPATSKCGIFEISAHFIWPIMSFPRATVSRITSIHKEIALALAAKHVRIEAPIPGKSTVGVEIPYSVVVR